MASSSGTRKRKWPIIAVGSLLILQALFLFCLFPVLISAEFMRLPPEQRAKLITSNGDLAPIEVDLDRLSQLELTFRFDSVSVHIPDQSFASLLFSLFYLPLLVTGILALTGKRYTWMLAVVLQGLLLALALVFYFKFHPPYVYLVMATCIFLVFYLNYYEVQVTFHVGHENSDANP